jgi:hypothetical protein
VKGGIVAFALCVLVGGISVSAFAGSETVRPGDLPRILSPRPPDQRTATFTFDPNGTNEICSAPISSGSVDLAHLRHGDAVRCPKSAVNELAKQGFQRGLYKEWVAAGGSIGASLEGWVFRTDAGAHAALLGLFGDAALGPDFASSPLVTHVKGLGREAFSDEDDPFYDVVWRVGNLLLHAEIGCDGDDCPFDVARATSAWAKAITKQATRSS